MCSAKVNNPFLLDIVFLTFSDTSNHYTVSKEVDEVKEFEFPEFDTGSKIHNKKIQFPSSQTKQQRISGKV